MNTLLFIYLALLPIGFNYGWLFQVRNRRASKTELSFLCFTIVSVGLCTWGQGGTYVFVYVCVCVCVKSFCQSVLHSLSSLSPCSSICLFACVHTLFFFFFVIDEHFSVCVHVRFMLCALCHVRMCMCKHWSALFFPAQLQQDWIDV